MKRLLTLSTFLLLSIMTFASTEVNGIYYEFSGTEATVVKGTNAYTGDITIPASVNYGGKTYSVTSIGADAFYNCSRLTSINIPNSVTSIGADAFYGCSGLTSVTIPNSVTSIGDRAFYNCSRLTSINIPNSVTSIEYLAFHGCSGLTSLTIGNSVTSIGVGAFDHCSGLTSIKVQEGNTKYDSRNNCNAIIETATNTLVTGCKNTIIPNNVTSIGADAFSGCSGLTSITIPNSVTSIGSGAFYGCSGLTSITIPNSVTSIGHSAFEYCSRLTSITIPNSVTSIGSYAFAHCSKLTSVTIPNSVTSIGDYAFWGCSGLTSIYSYIEEPTNSMGSIFAYSTYSNATLYVPKGTKEQYQSTDGWKNFANIVEMEPQPTASGTCGENLTWAYYEDDKELVISGIGAMDFYSVNTPAPWHSYNIKNVIIEEGVTSIENYAFSGCSGLTSITIPNSVTSIGGYAFFACSGLTSITIPNSVTSIGNYAFYHCSGLTSVTIGSSVTSIGEAAFYGCSGLTSLTIPNSVKIIGSQAFRNCSGLTSLIVSNSVKTIGSSVFYGCSALTSIDIPNSVTSVGESAFSGCSALTSITIPNSVTHLGSNAFSGCTELETVDIPNSVIELGFNAFRGCAKITSITIPSNMLEIGSWAFYGCSGLASIYSYIENPTSDTGSNFDSSNYTNATLYVPEGTKVTYQATDGWKNFANIVEMAPTPEPSSDNTLAMSNAETYAGKQVVLPIDMNNVASIKAFQFDLYLPDGITIAKDEDDEELIELTTRAAKSHTIAYSNRPDGAIRMVCTSMSGATFKGNEGAIVNVTLDVAQSMTDGDYDIEIKNIELSDGTPYNPADIKATLTVKTYTPGDVDGTGTVSVNDAVCIINYILGSPAEDFIEPAADLDGNGVITVNDVVILINDYILGGNSQNSLDLAFLEDVTADDDYLFINDITMKAGETTEVEVYMNTSRTDIQGLQCDIYLPDGMEFVPEEDGDEKYYADKGGRAAKSHSVAAQLMADGSVRVVETSTSGAKFKDNDQAVFYFTVRATANTAYGQGIRLCNMELSYGGAPINPEDRTFDVKVKAGTVSLNSDGYATFSHASDVEVEGAEVYTATRNGNIISCTKEEQSVAAFNGVILKGEPDATVTLYTNNGVDGYTGNELKPTTTAAGVADIETALVLSGNMFKNYTGTAFVADKAYMPYDGNSANAIEMVFNGATAIDGIASENNLLDGAVIKTVEDGKLVIKTANGKYSSVGAKMK